MPDGENPAKEFCRIKILAKIPFDNDLGMLTSNAEIAARKSDRFKDLFSDLLDMVKKEAQNEAVTNS